MDKYSWEFHHWYFALFPSLTSTFGLYKKGMILNSLNSLNPSWLSLKTTKRVAKLKIFVNLSVYLKYCYYHLVQMWFLKQLLSHVKYFLQGGLAAYAAFRILDDLINPDQVWLINYQSIASISPFSSSWIIFGIFIRLEVLQWTRHTRWERKPNDTHTGLMFSYKRLSLTFTNVHVLP